MTKRKIKVGRLLRFLLIIAIVAVVVVFYSQIGRAIYSATGVTWFLSGNEKHELSPMPEVNFREVSSSTDPQQTEQPAEQTQVADVGEQLQLPQGNNILGISYAATNADPGSLAVQSNTIYKVRITKVNTSTNQNMIFTEYQAQVKKAYKGQENKEIGFSLIGGSLSPSKLEAGYVADVAGKTKDNFGQTVNMVVDGQQPLEIGKDYLLFANNQNGIITPTSGRSSLFAIEKGKVTRNTMHGEEPFSMNVREFEKTYLNP